LLPQNYTFMIHSSILLFNWFVYGKGVVILTFSVWAIFLFYDYFIRTSESKDLILENPTILPKTFDSRPQIQTNTIEFDSMIK
jgi:hypothetical protein